jgi:hypothetical protein
MAAADPAALDALGCTTIAPRGMLANTTAVAAVKPETP